MKAPDKLRVSWSKAENDVMFHYPLGVSTKSDGAYLASIFTHEFCDELKSRGYDPTTMKFSIEPGKGCPRFASQREDLLPPNRFGSDP